MAKAETAKKEVSQTDLEGTVLPKQLYSHLECKHNSPDLITKDRKITLYGVLKGNKGGIGSFNLNLSGMSEAQYDDLLTSLNIPDLVAGTPLYLTVSRAQGEILDDWKKANTPKGVDDGGE